MQLFHCYFQSPVLQQHDETVNNNNYWYQFDHLKGLLFRLAGYPIVVVLQ
jgi:hypothetical protein